MITTIQATRDAIGEDMANHIGRRFTSSGAATKIDESVTATPGPSGLIFTCYRRVPRIPNWMNEEAVRSVSAKETYPSDHWLSPHVGQKVLHEHAHASLTSGSTDNVIYLHIEGKTLANVNRLFADIMSGKATWRW